MRRGMRQCFVSIILLSLFIAGCGNPAAPEGSSIPSMESTPSEDTTQVSLVVENPEYEAAPGTSEAAKEAPAGAKADFESYQAPPFADSAFHAEHAQGNDKVKIDLDHANQGYIGVSGQSDTGIKLQVFIGEMEYRYNVPADGTPVIFPLQEGDGTYTIKANEKVEDTKYRPLFTLDCEVKLDDEFQPFLRPSAYVDYDQDSECVKLAAQLAAGEEDALGVVGAVFEYICDNIVYDKEKAQMVQTTTGYMPVLDDTLRTGKGICFDYASLVAGMLRSQGIPTKMVFGDVSPDDIYHAWNMFYTEETGWVTVKYEVKADSWNRLDLTFSANGADSSFIGDGANYLDEKYY